MPGRPATACRYIPPSQAFILDGGPDSPSGQTGLDTGAPFDTGHVSACHGPCSRNPGHASHNRETAALGSALTPDRPPLTRPAGPTARSRRSGRPPTAASPPITVLTEPDTTPRELAEASSGLGILMSNSSSANRVHLVRSMVLTRSTTVRPGGHHERRHLRELIAAELSTARHTPHGRLSWADLHSSDGGTHQHQRRLTSQIWAGTGTGRSRRTGQLRRSRTNLIRRLPATSAALIRRPASKSGGQLSWTASPQVTGGRPVSFPVSFMFVYLRPPPFITAL
jgi:hypothetical protein